MSQAAHRVLGWFNVGFTIANISFNTDTVLKVAAFLFVTLPLGYVQWVSAVEKFKERRRKQNGS